jgi:hypothetical protein
MSHSINHSLYAIVIGVANQNLLGHSQALYQSSANESSSNKALLCQFFLVALKNSLSQESFTILKSSHHTFHKAHSFH